MLIFLTKPTPSPNSIPPPRGRGSRARHDVGVPGIPKATVREMVLRRRTNSARSDCACPALWTGPVCVVLWRRRAACCASLAFWPTRSAARHGTRAHPRPLRPTCPRCVAGRPADAPLARWTGPSLVPHLFPTPSWATWPAPLENAVLPGGRRMAVTGTLLAHSWARLGFFPGGSTTRIANAPKV